MGDEVYDLFTSSGCWLLVCVGRVYTLELTCALSKQVLVVTTHKGAPEEFHGAKVIGSWR